MRDTSGHHCHARGCETRTKPELLMCYKHWKMVSKATQRAVWQHYRPGQCDDMKFSDAWYNAAQTAIAEVYRKEQGDVGEFFKNTGRTVDRGDSRIALPPLPEDGGPPIDMGSYTIELPPLPDGLPPLPGVVPTEKQARDLDYQTPRRVLDLVDSYPEFNGQIDLDPFSCETNPTKAREFFVPARGPDGQVLSYKMKGFKKPVPLGYDLSIPPELRTDGLSRSWQHAKNVFTNPPYGGALQFALEKIARENTGRFPMLVLIPASRFEQEYFHRSVLDMAMAVCAVRKRLQFIRPTTGEVAEGNPYCSLLFGYSVHPETFCRHFAPLGKCIILVQPGRWEK
jgi:hypothetical protein